LLGSNAGFFLFPLQLDSDAQIRVHSRFGRMAPAIDTVIRSFAQHAPADVQLVISEHPLDQAVIDLHDTVAAAAVAMGIGDRIVYLRGGTPPPLLAACRGVVTVNSTIGLSAMEVGRPVATLGNAVYNIAGLIDDRPLELFWSQPRAPDPVLVAAFRRALIESTQLPGGYYGPAARRLAVDAAVVRLTGALRLPAIVPSEPRVASTFQNSSLLNSELGLSAVK
jgi:capsular polysaccharide export protein